MATILRTRIENPFSSVRGKIVLAFLLILGISYFVIANSTLKLVSDYQFKQRMDRDKNTVSRITPAITQLYNNIKMRDLEVALSNYSGEEDARFMVIDNFGKVRFDTYGIAEGTRLNLSEVASILNKSKTIDYGIYHISENEQFAESNTYENPQSTALNDNKTIPDTEKLNQNLWINICTAPIADENGQTGLLLYSSSVYDVINNLEDLRNSIMFFFALVAISTIIISYFIAGQITKPISSLTKVIKRMGQGEFSIKVPEKGSSELKNLAITFNIMSEKLDNLEKSRNQFISDASHEIKTPLATMKILLESIIYQDEFEPEITKEFLTDINSEIDRLNSITVDLLTLVSLDDKTVTINKAEIELTEIVQKVIKRLSLLADKNEQHLTVNINDYCPIYADETKIQQVIYNLVENAIKYTPKGGYINVSLYREYGFAVFKVTDDGPGIPSGDVSHIFERFYRVEKARSRGSGGTGLGLSIVSQMVKLHGGKISVNSEVGVGSQFIVELPLIEN